LEKKQHKTAWRRVSILTLTTTGRVRTIELTVFRIYLILALAALLIGFVIAVLFVKISEIASQRDDLVERNDSLNRSLSDMRSEIESLDEYQERIRFLIGTEVDSAVMASTEALGVLPEEAASGEEVFRQPVVQTSTVVGLENLRLRWRRLSRGDLRLSFSFNLANMSEGGGRVSGNVIVVAVSTREGSSTVGAYPSGVTLDGDNPLDYKQGSPYSIRRFKQVKGLIPIPSGEDPFGQLIVYVFLSDGRLIYRAFLPIEEKPS
jgi:hypothetical protein